MDLAAQSDFFVAMMAGGIGMIFAPMLFLAAVCLVSLAIAYGLVTAGRAASCCLSALKSWIA